MAFTRGTWTGAYFNEGNKLVYKISATFSNADADDFDAYWNNTLTKTTTAALAYDKKKLADDSQTKITISDTSAFSITVHQAVITDIDTVEDALVAKDSDVTTGNTNSTTWASGKITYSVGTP